MRTVLLYLVVVVLVLALSDPTEAKKKKFRKPTRRHTTSAPSLHPTPLPTPLPTYLPTSKEYETLAPTPAEYETIAPSSSSPSSSSPSSSSPSSSSPSSHGGGGPGESCTSSDGCTVVLSCASYGVCVNQPACHALCRVRSHLQCKTSTAKVPGCICRMAGANNCVDLM
jgi:hypothetical protein